jgi:hypothetical protein
VFFASPTDLQNPYAFDHVAISKTFRANDKFFFAIKRRKVVKSADFPQEFWLQWVVALGCTVNLDMSVGPAWEWFAPGYARYAAFF